MKIKHLLLAAFIATPSLALAGLKLPSKIYEVADMEKAKAEAAFGVKWEPGSAVYQYPNSQEAATLWYHDHALGMTRLNVVAGMAGFYFLRDSKDNVASNLPKGKYEVPLVFQDRVFNDDGTFKSDDDLRKLYLEAGLDESKDTIAYCRIGERSSHTWFVLQELLGLQNVKNYDGSWTEYGSLVGVPVALGDEAGEA